MSIKETKRKNYTSFERFILHLHPVNIDERAIRFNRTFGLGGISALLFVILAITGLILRFSYVPTVEHAYDSVVELQDHSVFGGFIRNLHHLSAMFFVVASFLHLIRVYYSQAIYQKRAQNWIFGLILFFLVVASNFTGYLLPWDQLSYWAVTVITQIIEFIPLIGKTIADIIRSGDAVNGSTLLNFYNLHTGIFPIFFILLMAFHFWLVRRAGGIALPAKESGKKVPVIPNLVLKEVMVVLVVVAILFLLSTLYQVPLLEQANPLKSPNPTKAPWYFLGAQELLLHLHPVFGAIIIPVLLTVYFFSLPYIKYGNINKGVWFNSSTGKKLTLSTAIGSAIYTFIMIVGFDHYMHFDQWLHNIPTWISNGVIPFLIFLLPISGYLIYQKKKDGVGRAELFMAATTIMITSYIMMLLIALLLRGKGMQLIF